MEQTCFKKSAALGSKEKSSRKVETAAAAQKPKVTELSATLEQAEGGVVVEATVAHFFE